MKITSLSSELVRLPFTHAGPPTGFGGRVWTTLDTLLVKVETDTGLVGWGEAFGYNVIPATRAALIEQVAPLAIGRDATQIAALHRELQQKLHNFGRNGPVTFALSGLDIALWDLAGKAAGLPLHRLLGGSAKARIPAYASLFRYGDPGVVADATAAAVEGGYRSVKLHEVTVDAVAAARRAAGPAIRLTVDTNCPWSLAEATRMAEAFEPHDLTWLEEPIWPPEDHEALARLSDVTPIPLAAGENAASPTEFRQMFEAEAIGIAQPSVTKIGGVTGMRQVMDLARVHNVSVVPHAPYFGPGLLATLHLIAADPDPDMLFERLFCDLSASLFGALTDAVDGAMVVPDGPGLGADPDPEILARHRA